MFKRLQMPSLSDALDEAQIGMVETVLPANEKKRQFQTAEEKRKYQASFTTTPPPLPNTIPKSSTHLVQRGYSIYAYPSMRLVKQCRSGAEAKLQFRALSQLLSNFRLDLIRPHGTCPKCALPLPENREEHVCP